MISTITLIGMGVSILLSLVWDRKRENSQISSIILRSEVNIRRRILQTTSEVRIERNKEITKLGSNIKHKICILRSSLKKEIKLFKLDLKSKPEEEITAILRKLENRNKGGNADEDI